MARTLRLEFEGALYHITSRGNRRETIYETPDDRERFLEILGGVREKYNWLCHAYCLMGNHYHLLIETPEANLSKGMRQLNGVYTQCFNKAHARVGHVFQGRYKAILVEKETYLLELARYIVLNPVRAGMVSSPSEWPWSSYRATAGEIPPLDYLSTDWLLSVLTENRDRFIFYCAIHRFDRLIYWWIGRPKSCRKHPSRALACQYEVWDDACRLGRAIY